MKRIIIFLTSILITNFIFAQSDKNDFYISDNPTANELTEIFRSATVGFLDPFKVVEKVAEKDNKAVKALEEFLFAVPKVKEKTSNDSTKFDPTEIEPNKLYAVHALDVIGTPEATQVMINVALTHFDIEVRGAAIRSLAFFSYYRAK